MEKGIREHQKSTKVLRALVETVQASVTVLTLILFTVIFALASLLHWLPAFAKTTSASLKVSAFVPARSRLTVVYQLSSLPVTPEDVDRGYIDVRAATVISITTNNKAGYLLMFEGLSWPFKEAFVFGLVNPVQVSSPKAIIHQPRTGSPPLIELSYRFVLERDAKIGTYPWPFSISLEPG